MNILVANIGNTKTSLGVFRNGKLIKTSSLNRKNRDSDHFLLKRCLSPCPCAVIYASVRPQVEKEFIRLVRKCIEVVPRKFKPPLKLKVDNPKEVGLDRIADCIAAYERVKGACIVVDCGTAITINFVDKGGAFCGGIIAPGVATSAKSLHDACALLSLVKITKPQNYVGKNTIDNIKSGVWLSIKGLIELATKGKKVPVIGTGGDAELFADSFDEIIPHLALEGIAHTYYKK